jgi:hypothetical protein
LRRTGLQGCHATIFTPALRRTWVAVSTCPPRSGHPTMSTVLSQYDAAASAVRSVQRRHLARGWNAPGLDLDAPDRTIDTNDVGL